MVVPVLKGLKPTKEEALPPVFYIRRLKTDGKREPAAQGKALLKTMTRIGSNLTITELILVRFFWFQGADNGNYFYILARA